ncbi:MAG: hypothetical protein V4669_05800 [Pseudomonadota bacterium]
MRKSRTYLSILMAALFAAAGVQAQTAPAAGSSDGPPAAGEASTQTNGVPNAKTTNSPFSEQPVPMSREEVRPDTRALGAAAETTATPTRAGEASTVVMGAPNVDVSAPAMRSRADVQNEVVTRAARWEAMRSYYGSDGRLK